MWVVTFLTQFICCKHNQNFLHLEIWFLCLSVVIHSISLLLIFIPILAIKLFVLFCFCQSNYRLVDFIDFSKDKFQFPFLIFNTPGFYLLALRTLLLPISFGLMLFCFYFPPGIYIRERLEHQLRLVLDFFFGPPTI